MSYHRHFQFASPFSKRHCVPLAIGHLAEMSGHEVAALAMDARATPADAHTEERGERAMLLRPAGYAWAYYRADLNQWCALAGLRVIQQTDEVYPRRDRITITEFARRHPRGRFFVLVARSRHAVAVVDGRIYGEWGARQRVGRFFELELNPQTARTT
jgi:hypothetical protein